MRARQRIDRIGGVQQTLVPPHTLRGIVCDPKLLEGIRELEAEPDLAHAHAPRDRTADVVLLLECNVHSLPAGVEVARVQVCRLGYVQEVVRVSAAEAVALLGRV